MEPSTVAMQERPMNIRKCVLCTVCTWTALRMKFAWCYSYVYFYNVYMFLAVVVFLNVKSIYSGMLCVPSHYVCDCTHPSSEKCIAKWSMCGTCLKAFSLKLKRMRLSGA